MYLPTDIQKLALQTSHKASFSLKTKPTVSICKIPNSIICNCSYFFDYLITYSQLHQTGGFVCSVKAPSQHLLDGLKMALNSSRLEQEFGPGIFKHTCACSAM
jgi:hypothetical protein